MQRLAEDATETIGELMEQTESPMVRLRAAQTVLDFNGLKDPQSGLWGWGIGSTDEEAVAREMASKPIRL